MALDHGYCGLHRIGYNRNFDYICPQCSIARIPPAKQYDFSVQLQKAVDALGVPLDPALIVP